MAKKKQTAEIKEHELDTTELSSPPKDTNDSNYWGEKMVKLQDRVNELELSLSTIHNKLNKVAGRLGI